jgi:hypothetical protein
MPEQQPAFEGWAVLEQMGHNTYAGKISEFVLGGTSLIRIEVPEIPERTEKYQTYEDTPAGCYTRVEKERVIHGRQAFTKLIGPSSVFAITPCTEEVARAAAEKMRAEPITCVQLPERLAIAAGTEPEDSDPEGQF